MRLAPKKQNQSSGFTMIEVAIAIGVVAIALVAILGVLPTGMQTQKENRDELIISEDAGIFLQGIRNGARGMDYLTNSVEEIFRVTRRINRNNGQVVNSASASLGRNFRNGAEVIGLLTTPAIARPGVPFSRPSQYDRTNVQAIVRAMSGVSTRNDPEDAGIFRYRLTVELNPMEPAPTTHRPGNAQSNVAFTNDMRVAAVGMANLHELRLTFQWPMYQVNDQWRVGRNKKTYRTLLNGNMTNVVLNGMSYHFFEPNSYTNASLAFYPQINP